MLLFIEDMTPESIRKQDESFKNDQRGIQKQELPKRIKDATDSFLHSLTRVFPEIPESGEKGQFFAEFRKTEN